MSGHDNIADIGKKGQVLPMKWTPSNNDNMRSRFLRRSIDFAGFGLIYFGGTALLSYLQEKPWEPNPFVLVAYAAGAVIYVLLPGIKKSDDKQA